MIEIFVNLKGTAVGLIILWFIPFNSINSNLDFCLYQDDYIDSDMYCRSHVLMMKIKLTGHGQKFYVQHSVLLLINFNEHHIRFCCCLFLAFLPTSGTRKQGFQSSNYMHLYCIRMTDV